MNVNTIEHVYLTMHLHQFRRGDQLAFSEQIEQKVKYEFFVGLKKRRCNNLVTIS